MAFIEVQSETECEGGWIFEIKAQPPDGQASACRLRLSWVDYEFWSGGRDSPSKVAAAVIRYLVESHPETKLPQTLDAATARRRHPDLDAHVSELI